MPLAHGVRQGLRRWHRLLALSCPKKRPGFFFSVCYFSSEHLNTDFLFLFSVAKKAKNGNHNGSEKRQKTVDKKPRKNGSSKRGKEKHRKVKKKRPVVF
jgi:hypothetical protein